MDELLSPSSSFSPPSPVASIFSAAVAPPVIEFASCEVPEQWLLSDLTAEGVGLGAAWAAGGSLSPDSDLSSVVPRVSAATQRPGRRRGRKPGPRAEVPTVSQVEAERQRREKLNRRLCDLRAAVPTVSRMDKASLLADATAYIAELRARVARLEAEAKQAAAARRDAFTATAWCGAVGAALAPDGALEVRMVGRDAAAVRLTTAARHAPARLMGALRSLELPVQHGCVSRVRGVTVQDVVVDVPAALQDHGGLRTALLQRLKES